MAKATAMNQHSIRTTGWGRSATERAVAAFGGIAAVIAEMNTIGTLVAAAVEEQPAATAEIARNVYEAVRVSKHIK